MSDTPVDRSNVVEGHCEPFPSFADFAARLSVPSSVGDLARVLTELQQSATPGHLELAVERATRWAAVDTGAIEGLYDVDRGFTMTVAAEAAAWDSMHLSVGPGAAESIADALRAHEFVLDIVTEARPVSETWIKSSTASSVRPRRPSPS